MLSGLTDMWRRLWQNRRTRRRTRSRLNRSRDVIVEEPPDLLPVDQDHLCTFRQQQLDVMEKNINWLLQKLNREPDDVPSGSNDECVVCTTSRASMQTFPCGHRVLCRKCFIKTIQVAIADRNVLLRCVLCRTQIVRLKHHPASRLRVRIQQTPPASDAFLPPPPYVASSPPHTSSTGAAQPGRRPPSKPSPNNTTVAACRTSTVKKNVFGVRRLTTPPPSSLQTSSSPVSRVIVSR